MLFLGFQSTKTLDRLSGLTNFCDGDRLLKFEHRAPMVPRTRSQTGSAPKPNILLPVRAPKSTVQDLVGKTFAYTASDLSNDAGCSPEGFHMSTLSQFKAFVQALDFGSFEWSKKHIDAAFWALTVTFSCCSLVFLSTTSASACLAIGLTCYRLNEWTSVK